MTDFYGNGKNSPYNSSGVHSEAELDSNHNQLNDKSVIDLMVKRDVAGQATVSFHFAVCGRSEQTAHASLIFQLGSDSRAPELGGGGR